MDFEIGQKYPIKNGGHFTLERIDDDPIYPFFGHVFAKDGSPDRLAFYTFTGRY
jgi:hypothetical protein